MKTITEAARIMGSKSTEKKTLSSRENWKKAIKAIAEKRASGAKWGGRKKEKKTLDKHTSHCII
jgi:hypothetical protein